MTDIYDILNHFGLDSSTETERNRVEVKSKADRTIVRTWLREQGVPGNIVANARYNELTQFVRDENAVTIARDFTSIEDWRREYSPKDRSAKDQTPKPVIDVDPLPVFPKTNPKPVVEDEKAKAIEGLLDILNKPTAPALPDEEIRRIAADEAKKYGSARPLEVKRWDGTIKKIRAQHRMFPLLLKCCEAGVHTALVGPAGTGKTTAAEMIAEALGYEFHIQSFCRQTTKSDLLGFTDAHGNYQTTPFRRWFENGGVFIGDEWDAGNENSNLIVNAGLANGVCNFADQQVKRHDEAVAIFAMNTWGGPNSEYVGRNRPDAATMDRMVALPWGRDESLEAAMVGVDKPQDEIDVTEGGTREPIEWLGRLDRVRKAVGEANVKLLLTPRAALFGAKLYAVGVGTKWVEELVLWKGLDSEQRKRVENKL